MGYFEDAREYLRKKAAEIAFPEAKDTAEKAMQGEEIQNAIISALQAGRQKMFETGHKLWTGREYTPEEMAQLQGEWAANDLMANALMPTPTAVGSTRFTRELSSTLAARKEAELAKLGVLERQKAEALNRGNEIFKGKSNVGAIVTPEAKYLEPNFVEKTTQVGKENYPLYAHTRKLVQSAPDVAREEAKKSVREAYKVVLQMEKAGPITDPAIKTWADSVRAAVKRIIADPRDYVSEIPQPGEFKHVNKEFKFVPFEHMGIPTVPTKHITYESYNTAAKRPLFAQGKSKKYVNFQTEGLPPDRQYKPADIVEYSKPLDAENPYNPAFDEEFQKNIAEKKAAEKAYWQNKREAAKRSKKGDFFTAQEARQEASRKKAIQEVWGAEQPLPEEYDYLNRYAKEKAEKLRNFKKNFQFDPSRLKETPEETLDYLENYAIDKGVPFYKLKEAPPKPSPPPKMTQTQFEAMLKGLGIDPKMTPAEYNKKVTKRELKKANEEAFKKIDSWEQHDRDFFANEPLKEKPLPPAQEAINELNTSLPPTTTDVPASEIDRIRINLMRLDDRTDLKNFDEAFSKAPKKSYVKEGEYKERTYSEMDRETFKKFQRLADDIESRKKLGLDLLETPPKRLDENQWGSTKSKYEGKSTPLPPYKVGPTYGAKEDAYDFAWRKAMEGRKKFLERQLQKEFQQYNPEGSGATNWEEWLKKKEAMTRVSKWWREKLAKKYKSADEISKSGRGSHKAESVLTPAQEQEWRVPKRGGK